MTYLLIVTALYAMAPDVQSTLRIEARDLSYAKCHSTGETVVRNLSWIGATDIEVKCKPMRETVR